MKSVLISIQPKWCEKICNIIGHNADNTPIYEKTIEVRKTKPKLETPFKVYIYCTKNKNGIANCKGNEILNGKVIGEFVCDYFYGMCQFGFGIAIYDKQKNIIKPQDFLNWSCLTEQQVIDYLGDGDGCAWHISNLVIYDKPKELGEFYVPIKDYWETYNPNNYVNGKFQKPLTRPPQSWCYVESEVEDNER